MSGDTDFSPKAIQLLHQLQPLSIEQFQKALAALPLVSVDWVLSNPEGAVLTGQRLNAPARSSWFTPGGRVRKGEPLDVAKLRIAVEELGASIALAQRWVKEGQLMGAWDHFYSDSAFSADDPTHYLNLPFWVALSWAQIEALTPSLPLGQQHSAWRWVPSESLESDVLKCKNGVHAYVSPYLAWVRAARELGSGGQNL